MRNSILSKMKSHGGLGMAVLIALSLSVILFPCLAGADELVEDSLYHEIRKKDINDMSDREYDYFMKMKGLSGAAASVPPGVEAREDREVSAQDNQERLDKKGFHQHDGLFVGISTGGAFNRGSFESNRGAETVSTHSNGSALNFQIGVMVAKNTVLAYTFASMEPGETTRSDSAATKGNFDTGLIAPFGVTLGYYLMPYNLYAGIYGSLFSIFPASGGTMGGASAGITVAKEWWVSKNWGLGISLGYLMGADIYSRRFEGVEDDGSYHQNSIVVAFRTTYN